MISATEILGACDRDISEIIRLLWESEFLPSGRILRLDSNPTTTAGRSSVCWELRRKDSLEVNDVFEYQRRRWQFRSLWKQKDWAPF